MENVASTCITNFFRKVKCKFSQHRQISEGEEVDMLRDVRMSWEEFENYVSIHTIYQVSSEIPIAEDIVAKIQAKKMKNMKNATMIATWCEEF